MCQLAKLVRVKWISAEHLDSLGRRLQQMLAHAKSSPILLSKAAEDLVEYGGTPQTGTRLKSAGSSPRSREKLH